ncbi:DMT family transporter [Halotalea alkalilenta]|uniref:DMT family transporter n=1 Tax=Halotalea alkalilenta TaxID=376489 RepID=UPI000484AA5C|nr:DMT family transporter [Halotalea alkalilenta]
MECSTSRSPARPVRTFLTRRALPLVLLEALLAIAWSSGFVGIRYSVDQASVLVVVFWRCLLVGLLLLPWSIAELRRAGVRTLVRHAGIGLLAMAGYLAGVAKGIEHGVPAGLAALIADLLPLGVALLSLLLLQRGQPLLGWLGLALGLGGMMIVTQGALALGGAPLWAYALPFAGMLSFALATLWQQRSVSTAPLGLCANLCLQCLVCVPVFGLWAASETTLVPPLRAGFMISLAWTAVLSTLGGYGLYWLCLSRSNPIRTASVLYLSPPITMLWAWVMFGEPLAWSMAVGMVVTLVGVWLVARAGAR